MLPRRLILSLLLTTSVWTSLAARAVTVPVVIEQVAFRENAVTVHVGDAIEWTNKDAFDHTATARNGEFDVVIPAGKKVRVVLKHAGTFEYYCRFHPNMVAKITVQKAR